MAEQKKQHYVPRFYMKNFANDRKGISVYNLNTGKFHNKVPFASQCYKNYFYGEDKEWEKHLSEKESSWSCVLGKAINHQILNNEDVKQIKEFALYQRMRTEGETVYHKEERTEMYVEFAKMYCANKGIEFKPEYTEVCKKKALESVLTSQLLENAKELVELIDDLKLLVIQYETEAELISSDVPVIVINTFDSHCLGFAMMGIVLLFPIDRHKLIVIYDGKMYTRFRKEQYLVSNDDKEVFNLNAMQYISAEKIVFGYRQEELDAIVGADYIQEERKRCRERQKVDSLGVSTNKMMHVSVRNSFFDCDLSFAHVPHDARKIPVDAREAVPRVYDEGWSEKLRTKENMLPQIFKFQNTKGFNIKELKRGYRKMSNYAESYWKKK